MTTFTATSDRSKLTIGSRGSKLALWQSNYVKGLIEDLTGLPVDITIIKTTGDKILDVPLAKVGGKGLFTKEIEVALLDGRCDLAVHSMKDVPTNLPAGCILSGMPPREDPRDVLVARAELVADGRAELDTLPQGARIGTSSLRRISQLRHLRPDVEIVDVRGNLDTRMRKAEDGEVDAVILAAAGIRRMGWAERISTYIPTEQMVSAVGQGAVGIEIRDNDPYMQAVCTALSDEPTLVCVTAERVVMNRLDGGCQVPIGAYCRYSSEGGSEELLLDAMVGSVDGTQILRTQVRGVRSARETVHWTVSSGEGATPWGASKPVALGEQATAALKAQGATDILAAIREANAATDLLT